jgi:regulator of sigma E protease
MGNLLQVLCNILGLVLVFGLAVFVHEFGHMIFALVRGVGVESFAIGMGPKITSWKWKGIDFSLRWFPVGGFVKLEGRTPPAPVADEPAPAQGLATAGDVEVDKEEAGKDDKTISESAYDDLYALQDKGFLTKVLVFGGGVFMNYVTAVVALTLLAVIGISVDLFKMKVENVEPGTLLAKAGLKPGDQVVAVGKTPITYYNDLDKALVKELKPAGDKAALDPTQPVKLTLTVDRAGKQQTLALPEMAVKDLGEFQENLANSIWRPALVANVAPNSPADAAGMKQGDQIVAIAGKPVDSYSQMVAGLSPNVNQPTPVKVKRGEKLVDLTLTPRPGLKALDEDTTRGYIGVVLGSTEKRKEREANPFKALYLAQQQSVDRVSGIVKANVRFFKDATMSDVRKNVTGPIGIAVITYKMAQSGWEYLVNWFVNLNLLLMIFNLLPLPVLDGGFILLALIEGIIRRPVPPKVLGPVYSVFVVGFIILMVLISVQDFTRLLTR